MELATLSDFFTSLPTDWIIIGAFALLMIVDALRVGVGRIATLAISVIVASVLSKMVPAALFIGQIAEQLSTPVLQAALFGIVLVAVFLLIRRVFIDYGEMSCPPIQALFAGVAVTALIVLVWVQIPALDAVWEFDSQVQAAFGADYRFWWLLGSLAALAFARPE